MYLHIWNIITKRHGQVGQHGEESRREKMTSVFVLGRRTLDSFYCTVKTFRAGQKGPISHPPIYHLLHSNLNSRARVNFSYLQYSTEYSVQYTVHNTGQHG